LLSYRHAYHAGNFADVLKHIVAVDILEYLCKKQKAFSYIDTHAGAGLYHLRSEHGQKLEEYRNGIAKLTLTDWPELKSYLSIVRQSNSNDELTFYPGSPLIAKHFLRPQDKAWLYELHPSDFTSLSSHTADTHGRMTCFKEDGFKGLLAQLPPLSRRAFVLIDPPYEIKHDYEKVFDTLNKAYQKFSTGCYALWYPVVQRSTIDRLENQFRNSKIRDIQRFELGLSGDSEARGMSASGVIVINPSWGLYNRMSTLLPKLCQTLAGDNGHFRCDILVDE